MPQDITNQVLLERAVSDLGRIKDEAAKAGGELSVLACLVGMAADEAGEQLAMLKFAAKRPAAKAVAEALS